MIRSQIAPLRTVQPGSARALKMTFLWALLALALHVLPGPVGSVHAQGSRKDDIVFNSRGIPLAGATIRVCAMPASGQPCTPLALIYSDAGLTQALANPTTSDGLGNYSFYAAPGKYEIEISGPGITTKQLPNVILPNDPSSPTFSGAVSAFSLSLGGNLTVSGNTTVLGSLLSGTLTLNNQSTPPGAAGTGTVNMYTKTADKRLYYKDETGTEIGPLGPGTGAQTNVANTFTAPQSIAADFHTKGPNPFFDLALAGGYQATTLTPPTLSCTTTAGQNTMSCPGGLSDFLIGHGVAIPLAGVAPTTLPPGSAFPITGINVASNVATVTVANFSSFAPGASIVIAGSSDSAFNGTFTAVNDLSVVSFTFNVTHANCSPCTIGSSATANFSTPSAVNPQGILNGSTTWNYKVVPIGFHWELQAANSTPFTTTTGAATLGVNSVSIAANGCVENNGVMTITTTANHNFQSGVPVNIPRGTTGSTGVEGSWVIASTPTATTFTVNDALPPNGTYCPSGGTAQVVAKNLVLWTMQPYDVAGYYIYRSQGAGSYSLVGQTSGMDSSFTDWGLPAPVNFPAWVPSTPPTTPLNGILATTITNIVGATVTLASNAVASASSTTVSHDNAPNILSLCASSTFFALGGDILLSQNATNNGLWPVNSPLDMNPCAQQISVVIGAPLIANFPISPNRQNMFMARTSGGSGNGGSSPFAKYINAAVQGNGRPLFLLKVANGGDITFKDLQLKCPQTYQDCVVQEQDNTGNNTTVNTYDNVNLNAGGASTAFQMGGGFGFNFRYGGIGNSPNSWGTAPPGLLDTNNQGFGNFQQQLAGIVEFYYTNLGGTAWEVDYNGATGNASCAGHWTLYEVLNESSFEPSLRFNCGSTPLIAFHIERMSYADPIGGLATPVADITNSSSISDMRIIDPFCATSAQAFFSGAPPASAGIDFITGNEGCAIGLPGSSPNIYTNLGGGGVVSRIYNNVPVEVTGTGQFYYPMTPPSAAPTTALSSGGTLSLGNHTYQITGIDVNGRETTLGPSTTVNVTTGNQTVTVTPPTLPSGAIGYRPYRDGLLPNIGSCGTFITGTTPFVDSSSITCGVSPPGINTATTSSLSSNGVSTYQLKMANNFADTIAPSPLTAARTGILPDASGMIPVSSYLNSAYDNAKRANGAIGSNWTVTHGGINVSSNALVGTSSGADNSAAWVSNSFSSFGQFAEATVASLNGTSDFVGPSVMNSIGAANFYDCIEDTTTLIIQRVTASSGANLVTTSVTGSPGDVLRLEASVNGPTTTLTCYQNGVQQLQTTDTTYTSGSPGVLLYNNVATLVNWTGGNLHPLAHLDQEQDWTKTQHFTQGVALGGVTAESFNNNPRAEQSVFLPGALTSTWTGSTWTLDKPVTVTRVQVQAKTAPAGCTTNAVVRLTDGTSPVNLTISGAANDSGALAQSYAAGAALTIAVQTAAAGCSTSPADANVVVQYRMQ